MPPSALEPATPEDAQAIFGGDITTPSDSSWPMPGELCLRCGFYNKDAITDDCSNCEVVQLPKGDEVPLGTVAEIKELAERIRAARSRSPHPPRTGSHR